ncbi:MAG: oxidoreductase [Bacteroidota bacterium]
MSHDQQPISSGFSNESTADEVLEGVDLSGETILVTGGYSGLGLETTEAFHRAGATVWVAGRRPDVAREALSHLSRIRIVELDLSDLKSVAEASKSILNGTDHLDRLVLNAAVMACPLDRIGDGWESQFATNHLGHYALVCHLWPLIQRSRSRIVSVSSAGHHHSGIRWDDIDFESTPYDKWVAYGQSKTANALFARELDRRGEPFGIHAWSVHPGSILTPLQRHLTREEMIDLGWVNEKGELINPTFKTPEQGAATQVWAATSPDLVNHGGVYCEDCDIAVLAGEETPMFVGVKPWACDPDEASRLWDLSRDRTGLDIGST